MKDYAVVIGGGLAGVISSKILIKKGYNVKLIESSNNLGGLMSSIKVGNYYFDHGPHKLQELKNININKDLFKNFKKFCNFYKFLPQEHFFNNKWYRQSSFLNIKNFNKNQYKKLFFEFLKNKKKFVNFKNERERCENLYGKYFTTTVIEPILKKYTNKKLIKLEPYLKEKFNLSRFIIANKKITNILKKNSNYDNIIAFNSYKKGISGRLNYYPKKKGISEIINFFTKEKLSKKLQIFLNEKIIKIVAKNNKIKKIICNNNSFDNPKIVIWAGTLESLNNLIKKVERKNNKKQYSICWSFFHYLSKTKLSNKCFYSYVYEKNGPIYRITHYDNFQKKNKKNLNRITVETILPKNIKANLLNKKILEQLKKINLIKNKDSLKLVKNYSMPFKINKSNNIVPKQFKKISNLYFVGSSVNKFGKEEIIEDVYEKLLKIS